MQAIFLIYSLGVAFLVAVAIYFSYGCQYRTFRSQHRRLFYYGGAVIAGIRLSAFWYLIFAEATGRQSLSFLYLIILLFPEAYFVPQEHVWSVPSRLLFSIVLLVGSLAMSWIVTRLTIAVSTTGRSE